MFATIPDKMIVDGQARQQDVWPEYGDRCEMNLFYRTYSFAEGWIGDGFLVIWSRREIACLAPIMRQSYPADYHFFASDDCGNHFAFRESAGRIQYVSAPYLGNEDDIRVLGDWEAFLNSVRECDYV